MINLYNIADEIIEIIFLNTLFIDDNFIETIEAKHNYFVSKFDDKPFYLELINNLEDSYNLMKSEFTTEVSNFDFESIHAYLYDLLNVLEELV